MVFQVGLGALALSEDYSGVAVSHEWGAFGANACPKWIELNPDSPEYDGSAIECVASAFVQCTPGTTDLHKHYNQFFRVIIQQQVSEVCYFNMSSFAAGVGGGFEYAYNCAVPSSVMPHWTSWRIFPQTWVNETLKEIAEYCGKNPGDLAPQNARLMGLQPASLVVLFLLSVFSVLGVFVLVKVHRRRRHGALRQVCR